MNYRVIFHGPGFEPDVLAEFLNLEDAQLFARAFILRENICFVDENTKLDIVRAKGPAVGEALGVPTEDYVIIQELV